MILYVDIGNSRLKWRVESGGVYFAGGDDGLDQLESIVRSIHHALGESGKSSELEQILVSSVASDRVNADFCRFCEAQLNISAHFVAVEKVYGGVTAAYSDTSTLGVDRWLAMLAAYERADSSCLVIDAGSAITVDLLSSEGVHGGGMIAPGLRTLAHSLKRNTKKVAFDPLDLYGGSSGASFAAGDLSRDVSLELGQSTSECVEAGVSGMFYGFISSVVYCFSDRFDSVCVAGGDGARVMHLLGNMFSRSSSGSPQSNLGSLAVGYTNGIIGLDGGSVRGEFEPKKLSYCPDLVLEGLKRWYMVSLHS